MKDKYHNDPEFRKKHQETAMKYYKERVAGTDKARERAKEYYLKNKERILTQCKERRNKAKNKLNNSNNDEQTH